MSWATRVIEVAVGVVCRADEILIAKRHAHVHLGGMWEFPGGKIEAAESARQALERELYEEVGICVLTATPLTEIIHHYPERSVKLHVFKVPRFSGEPENKEQQIIQWCRSDALTNYAFPPANQEILSILNPPIISDTLA